MSTIRWLRVDRGSKRREFARPLSQRRESQRLAQNEFGKRGFRNRHGSDEIEVFFEFLPRAIRFATQHQIIRVATMAMAELQTSHQHGLHGVISIAPASRSPGVPLFIKMVVLGVTKIAASSTDCFEQLLVDLHVAGARERDTPRNSRWIPP